MRFIETLGVDEIADIKGGIEGKGSKISSMCELMENTRNKTVKQQGIM